MVIRLSHRVWRSASGLLFVAFPEVSAAILMRELVSNELLNPDPIDRSLPPNPHVGTSSQFNAFLPLSHAP